MMKKPLLLLTTGYETSQLTRFETIFNKYFNKLLFKTKLSAKSDDKITLFTARKLAIVFNKLEIYLNNVDNGNNNINTHINLIDILSDVNFLFSNVSLIAFPVCIIRSRSNPNSIIRTNGLILSRKRTILLN